MDEIEKTEKERIRKKGKQFPHRPLISPHVGLKTLKNSGIQDAYQHLLTSLCKYGLPTGDLYEFSALTILKYEKKLKAQKKKELEERLQKRGNDKIIKPKNVGDRVDQLITEEQTKGKRVASVSPKPEKMDRKGKADSAL